MEVFECISIIATVIRIWFSLTDTHKPPHSQRHTHTHTQRHHPWQAACGEAAQGCHIILNIHQLSRDIILAPHLHTVQTEWQTRGREGERERASPPLLHCISYMAAFHPSTPLFAPSISLSLPSNLLNWITTASKACVKVCARIVAV